MSRGPDESLQSSAWLTQICNGAKQICDFRKKGSIVGIEKCNYKLSSIFGRTKPNCAVLSMAASGAVKRAKEKVRVAGLVLGPGFRLEAVMRRMLIIRGSGHAPARKPSLLRCLGAH